jgi:hypothetical protein
MVSRLLSALDVRIAHTRDPIEHACLSAERATLLARQGHLEEARAELESIRTRFAKNPNALVTAWVCLGEGMVAFFRDFARSARDKFLRANALSSAANLKSVRSVSAAWLAHMDYLDQDFESMVSHLEVALREATSQGYLAQGRSAIVAAQAFHWAGNFDLARPWYEHVRQCAINSGDETLLSARMHNMSWLRMAEIRQSVLVNSSESTFTLQVLLGAEATDSFDERVGTASLRTLVPVLRAHVLSLLGRYSEALELFDANISNAFNEGLARIECSVLAEVAWCHASVGNGHMAMKAATLAEERSGECNQPDELAATFGRLAQTSHILGNFVAAERQASRAAIEWERHGAAQSSLIALLSNSASVGSYLQKIAI